jgi:hypothetical protein
LGPRYQWGQHDPLIHWRLREIKENIDRILREREERDHDGE